MGHVQCEAPGLTETASNSKMAHRRYSCARNCIADVPSSNSRSCRCSSPAALRGSGAFRAAGRYLPDAVLPGAHGSLHLTQCFDKDFVCLVFGDGPMPEAVAQLADDARELPMNDDDLDRSYSALCESLASVGEKKRSYSCP